MEEDTKYFGILDFAIFIFLLASSAFIGIYFGYFSKHKQNNMFEYLLGSRVLGVFPVAMSLTASYMSGLFILGYAAEVYNFGTQLWMISLSKFFVLLYTIFFTLPIYYDLQVYSSFQYYQLRYNNGVRILASGLFLLSCLISVPIVIYMPALAFGEITGISIKILIPLVCCVCIFYTAIGGLRAVVWTDTLQMIFIIIGMFTVAICGTQRVGGIEKLWDLAQKSGRIEFFNMDFDPTLRNSFWTVVVGKFVDMLRTYSISQSYVQRCLSLGTRSRATCAIFTYLFFTTVLFSVSCYQGLVLYAAFHDCDPVTVKLVRKPDGILPYFVMKFMNYIPGLLGIFVSGVFSAALSTMSTDLNALTGVIMVDFVQALYKKPIPEKMLAIGMKIFVMVLGFVFVAIAFAIDQFDSIVQVAGTLKGFTSGTTIGIFTLGIWFPWANSIGAMVGAGAGSAFMGWIIVGAQLATKNKQIVHIKKELSIAGCDNSTLDFFYSLKNQTNAEASSNTGKPFVLFTVSYLYFTAIGFLVTLIVGLIVSFLTGPNDPKKMDPRLFTPAIRKYFYPETDVALKNKLIGKTVENGTKEEIDG